MDVGRSDISVRDDHEGVDLEVRELTIDVDSVEAGDEVDEHGVDPLGNVLEECCGDFLVAGVLAEVDGNEELLGLGVNIADVDSSFMVEEDPIALERGCQLRVVSRRLLVSPLARS